MGKMITLKEYCERNGYVLVTMRQKAARGGFDTAVKMGRDWFIDEDEPAVDHRVKTGQYIGSGWYEKYGRKRYEDRKEEGSDRQTE